MIAWVPLFALGGFLVYAYAFWPAIRLAQSLFAFW